MGWSIATIGSRTSDIISAIYCYKQYVSALIAVQIYTKHFTFPNLKYYLSEKVFHIHAVSLISWFPVNNPQFENT